MRSKTDEKQGIACCLDMSYKDALTGIDRQEHHATPLLVFGIDGF